MTKSKTRYFKTVEIDTNIFNTVMTPADRMIQTTQIPGLETRCDKSKLGFHFWAFLPGGVGEPVKCLACGKVVKTLAVTGDAPS